MLLWTVFFLGLTGVFLVGAGLFLSSFEGLTSSEIITVESLGLARTTEALTTVLGSLLLITRASTICDLLNSVCSVRGVKILLFSTTSSRRFLLPVERTSCKGGMVTVQPSALRSDGYFGSRQRQHNSPMPKD